ncbi:hypothetical protein [Lacticaseibacillus pantheris]
MMEQSVQNTWRKSGLYSIMKIINMGLISIMSLFAILTPAGSGTSVNFKVLLLGAIILLNLFTIIGYFLNGENLANTLLFVFFPLVLLIISSTQVEISKVLASDYVFLYMWVLPVLIRYNINFQRIFLFAIKITAALIVISAFLDKFGGVGVYSNPILTFLDTSGNAQVSVSANAIFGYVIFLNASPLILILLVQSLSAKNFLYSVLAVLGLFFSGTRANIYMAIVVTVLFLIFYVKSPVIRLGVIMIIALVGLRFGSDFMQRVRSINDAKINGDSIRNETVPAIFDSMRQNPLSYFVGNGLGSSYYSAARGGVTQGSEWSYFELVRQMGVAGAGVFALILLRPLQLLKSRETMWLGWSYVGYLVIAVTEPFIFTSTGFLLYLFLYYEVYQIGVKTLTHSAPPLSVFR